MGFEGESGAAMKLCPGVVEFPQDFRLFNLTGIFRQCFARSRGCSLSNGGRCGPRLSVPSFRRRGLKIPRPQYPWGICALVLALSSASARATCNCGLDRIAAAGTTMSAEGMRGPCGQLMSAAKVVAAQSAEAAASSSQAPLSAPESLSAASTRQVAIYSNFFDDQSITVAAGDTVKWTLVNALHTVTADTGLFDSGALFDIGQTYSFTFNAPGTYGYYCQFHGVPGALMFGEVNVVAAPEPVAAVLALPAMLLLRRRGR
jgi:plastocyanin